MVVQNKFGFRKAFVPNDTELAMRVALERRKYGRIIVMSLEPLTLPGFKIETTSTTGLISLEPDYESVFARFHKTVRKQIARTYRDPGLTFTISKSVTDDGYALLEGFMEARGMAMFPRSTYAGCVEFLAYADEKPVSGVILYPSSPVPMTATFFSKRLITNDSKEYRRIGNASKRLIAEVCSWGIGHGMKAIDIGSLNPDSQSIPGITEYKLSFAPNVVPQYVYTYRSPLFRVGERMMFVFRTFQKKFLSRTSRI